MTYQPACTYASRSLGILVVNKSYPKSFGKSASLPLTAENALVCCV